MHYCPNGNCFDVLRHLYLLGFFDSKFIEEEVVKFIAKLKLLYDPMDKVYEKVPERGRRET